MSAKRKLKQTLSETEIDEIVVSQVSDDAAWDEPVHVHRKDPTSLSIPGELAARAAFLAQLHRTTNVEEWLARIIQERVELEEAAFVGAKQELSEKAGADRSQ